MMAIGSLSLSWFDFFISWQLYLLVNYTKSKIANRSGVTRGICDTTTIAESTNNAF